MGYQFYTDIDEETKLLKDRKEHVEIKAVVIIAQF
jgi:hypothetical protein